MLRDTDVSEQEVRSFLDFEDDEPTPDVIQTCTGEWRRNERGTFDFHHEEDA